MPVLHDIVPTEGIAINLDTFRAFIAEEQGAQRDFSMLTRQFVGRVEFVLGECFVGVDILDDAQREMLGIQPIERILALVTLALLRTGFPGFQARTSSAVTALMCTDTLTHLVTPLRSSLRPSGSLPA
jgi:hypothetical protein